MKHKFLTYIICFWGLILLFVALMVLVYSLPNDVIDVRQQQGVELIRREGFYPDSPFVTEAARLDNGTDRTMLGMNDSQNMSSSPLHSAMDTGSYPRYWHGYQIFLRPLLRLFTYEQIRFFNMAGFLLLFCLSFSMIHKKTGLAAALCYLFSLVPLYPVILPLSLQFMSVFTIMFLAVLYILYFYGTKRLTELPLFFMIIGMITNFLDLLTAPLITLGIPLLIYLALDLTENPEISSLSRLKKEVSAVLAWFLGYGLCWVSKWCLATVVLKENIIADALESIVFRTSGSEAWPLSRVQMFKLNLSHMFASAGEKVLYLFLLGIFLLFLLLLFLPLRKRIAGNLLTFVLPGLLPYLWYMVLANHSQIHYWFTYRIQAVSLLSLLLFFCFSTDLKRGSLLMQKWRKVFPGKGK